MPIDFVCFCGKRLQAKDGSGGRTVVCPGCKSPIEIPAPGAIDLGISLGPGASPQSLPPPTTPCEFEYAVLQLSPSVEVEEGESHRSKAAHYLEEILNKMAAKGWEFQRIDSMGILENPGCFAAMFGQGPRMVPYNVATFRRPRQSS